MTSDDAGAEPRLAESTEQRRLPEHEVMGSLVGKWINAGETIRADDAPALAILTSDIYEWVAGGFFVLHTAYGRIGDSNVGGIEIIGYDTDAKTRPIGTYGASSSSRADASDHHSYRRIWRDPTSPTRS